MHLMNMAELMEFLRVKRSTVYKLRDEGLPTIHLGRVVRFDREEIIRWLKDKQRSEPPRPGGTRLDEEEVLL